MIEVGPGQWALFSIFGRQHKIALGNPEEAQRIGALRHSEATTDYNNCLALAPYRLAALILFR
jgi:hypothetical protein